MLTIWDSFYEGHSMDLVTFATRVCKVLGIETIIGMFSPCLSVEKGVVKD